MCKDTGSLACDGCHLDHPLDRLACAVIKQALLDTRISDPGDRPPTSDRNERLKFNRDRFQAEAREAALSWLRNDGRVWMILLDIQPGPILRRAERG